MEQQNTIDLVQFKMLGSIKGTVQIESSQAAHDILREFWSEDIGLCESFYVVALTRDNRVINVNAISKGGRSSTIVDPKMVFMHGLKSMASALIVAHNHPSGNRALSDEDRRITKKLREVGFQLEMPLLDHLILLPEGGYVSFADEGEL